jgi:hypothetical protein
VKADDGCSSIGAFELLTEGEILQLESYFQESDGGIEFSRQQSSDFAKSVAGDFNPLHDTDAKRFCVPGDLLFAVFLHRHGVYESMHFDFQNMVDSGVRLVEKGNAAETVLSDDGGREFMTVKCTGNHTTDSALVSGLTRAYVQFSGQTFPYLLVDLMQQHEVMINPARPLVIYRNMQLSMDALPAADVTLEFSGADLHSEGKKATVNLNFAISAHDKQIGTGRKQMVLGGLRPYEHTVMTALVEEYQSIKSSYQKTG